jgi:phospholipid/cholesterol/gamma-HCH transport system substrate-binding protein
VVLNGGGLSQIHTITTELNAAFTGREPEVRRLIGNLGTFVGTLDSQRANIVRAIDGLDRLSTQLNTQRDTVAHALSTIPGGLSVLNDQRSDLVHALQSLSDLGDVANRVVNSSKDDLVANLSSLRPALRSLADSGENLTQSLSMLTFPFPANTAFPSTNKGDYSNLYVTLDLTPETLARNFGVGFDLPNMPMLDGLPPLGAGQGNGNPLEIPFVPGATQLVPNAQGLVPVPLPDLTPSARGSQRHRKPDPDSSGQSGGGLLGPIVGGR